MRIVRGPHDSQQVTARGLTVRAWGDESAELKEQTRSVVGSEVMKMYQIYSLRSSIPEEQEDRRS